MTFSDRPTSSTTWSARPAKSLATKIKAFAEKIDGLGARVATLTESSGRAEPRDASLEILQQEHEALLVAEEELRVQLDELEASEAKIQSERARYDALFAAAPDGYAITDGYGVVEEANPALARLLAIEGKFLLKKPLASFVAPADGARFRSLLSSGFAWPFVEIELAIQPRHSDEARACSVVVSALEGVRGDKRLFWRFRQMRPNPQRTPRVPPPPLDTEESSPPSLQELRDEVERERAARTTHQTASRAKDRLFEMVSHDLRGPLHCVLGWARLLKRTSPDPLRDRAIAAIERSGRAQLSILDDLLDAAHIAANRFELESSPVDFGAIVTQCVEARLSRAAAAAVELRWYVPETPVVVVGDERRLRQVVDRLLDNALKFTPAAGSVRVSLGCEASGITVLGVRDSGRGIEAAALPDLFDRFARDTGARRGREGLGLSLHIVRHVVERHGGSIQAQSDGHNRGAVFTVRLPMERSRVPAAPPSTGRLDHALRGAEVLVACEDEETRELLAHELRRHAATVSTARDEANALALFDAVAPDAVVLDVSPNAQRGAALVRAIRARLHGDVPIVALGSSSASADVANVFDAGVDAHLGKPFAADELVDVMTAVLNGRD